MKKRTRFEVQVRLDSGRWDWRDDDSSLTRAKEKLQERKRTWPNNRYRIVRVVEARTVVLPEARKRRGK